MGAYLADQDIGSPVTGPRGRAREEFIEHVQEFVEPGLRPDPWRSPTNYPGHASERVAGVSFMDFAATAVLDSMTVHGSDI